MTQPDYVPDDSSTANNRIAREGYFERKSKENDIQLKMRELIQKDEHKNVNKHSEGFCWGCNRRDYIISSLFYSCKKCMEKRGSEALLAIVHHKPIEEMCDFCGKWQEPFGTWQINISVCKSCMGKIEKLHLDYKKAGGMRKQNPFMKRMRKKYGKDFPILMKNPARKLGI